MKFHRALLLAATASLFCGLSLASEGEARIKLDIAAQPLGSALMALGEQSSIQVLMKIGSQAIEATKASSIVGEFTVREALERLLSDSGLTYEFVNDRTVRIAPARTNAQTTSYSSDGKEIAGMTLAQNTGGEQNSPRTSDAKEEHERSQEIVVTGSYIRGASGAGSKVIVIGREEIEHSGHARLEDFFETLPQNFSGSGSEDRTGGSNTFNVNRGTTIDLRGLGPGTTLILVNGRRQPRGDLYGGFVDISSIPSSAVERIEILTDGASALYGSDAIGGVVNFILRKDYEGAETRLRFGSLDGDADEIQFAQLLGKSWSSGNAAFGYQYYERDPLKESAIPYLATNGDQRKFGGTDLRSFASSPGVILCPGQQPNCTSGRPAYAIPTGQNGSSLSTSDLVPLNGVLPLNYPLGVPDKDYLAQEELHTVFLSASQQLTEKLELFAEGRYAQRDMKHTGGRITRTLSVPSNNPFYVNPFPGTTSVNVAYDFSQDGLIYKQVGDIETHAEILGMTARLDDWQVTVSGSYGEEKNLYLDLNNVNSAALNTALRRTDSATAFNAFGQGANSADVINGFRSSGIGESATEIWGAGVLADGPLFRVFDHEVRLAVGADYRAESLYTNRVTDREFPNAFTDTGSKDRTVAAAFAEFAVPLIGGADTPGGTQLELSLAGRYEDYSDFGETFNPKVGLRWVPLKTLQLRGSWGTSFRAPQLAEITPVGANALLAYEFPVSDPGSPGNTLSALFVGGPRNLHEETADVLTAGFDFSPTKIEGLRVSATYFDIRYKDKIVFPRYELMLANPAPFGDAVIFNPPQQLVSSACGSSYFLFGDCSAVDVFIAVGLVNASKVRVNGIDFDVSHTITAGRSVMSFGVGGSRTLRYDQVIASGAPTIHLLDTVGNPLALRLRATASWTLQHWGANLAVNHAGSYDNPSGIPATMDSHTTVDLNLSYRIASDAGWRYLGNSKFSLSVVNAFDELPPFLNTLRGYDLANGDVTGRKLNLLFTKEW